MTYLTLETQERDGTDPMTLNALGWVSGVRWTWRWPGGCWELSANVDLPRSAAPRAAMEGRRLFARLGAGGLAWQGTVERIDRGEPWQLKAEGLAQQAGRVQGMLGPGDSSTNVGAAVNNAIMRSALVGWQPTGGLQPGMDPGLPASLTTANVGTIKDMLDASMVTNGRRWGVDQFGVVRQPAVPTVPDLVVYAPVNPLGRTLDGFATSFAKRYVDEADPTGNTIKAVIDNAANNALIARYGVREVVLDVTKYGPMNASEASGIGAGAAAVVGPRPAWTGGVTIGKGQVTNSGGVPVHPAAVTAGMLVRFIGSQPGVVAGEVGRCLAIDVLLGESVYDHDSETVTVAPVNARPSSLAEWARQVEAGVNEPTMAEFGYLAS